MRTKQCIKKLALTFLLIWWGVSVPAGASGMGLTDLLMNNLGVTKPQAEGGSGALFKLAKERLSKPEFQQVAKTVPNTDALIKAAPETGASKSGLGKITSLLGGNKTSLGGMAGLTDSFSKLGLSGGMVGKFTPIILDYVQNKGGTNVMNLLKGAWK